MHGGRVMFQAEKFQKCFREEVNLATLKLGDCSNL